MSDLRKRIAVVMAVIMLFASIAGATILLKATPALALSGDQFTKPTPDPDSSIGINVYGFFIEDVQPNSHGNSNFDWDLYAKIRESGVSEDKLVEFITQPVDRDILKQAADDVNNGAASTIIELVNRDKRTFALRNHEFIDPIQGLAHAEAIYSLGLWPKNATFQFENYVDTTKSMQDWSEELLTEFRKSRKPYEQMLDGLWSVYDSADKWWIEQNASYTSMMHQRENGLGPGVPLLINEDTEWKGGHFLCFTVDGKKVMYRLECGYQPCDIPPWHPDPPSETTTTTTTTTTTSTPDETTTTTTVTTTLQPKSWPDTPEPNPDGQGSQDSQMTDPTPEPNPDDYATTTTKATTTRRTTTTTRPPVTTHPPVTTTAPPLDSEVDVNPSPTETGGNQPNDGNDGDIAPPF